MPSILCGGSVVLWDDFKTIQILHLMWKMWKLRGLKDKVSHPNIHCWAQTRGNRLGYVIHSLMERLTEDDRMLFEEQVSIKAIILDEKNHSQILSPPYNDNSFCPESVFCPFDSWLTYFAALVIIEYWKIFQWLRLRRPNVFTRFFFYGMCQNSDYTRQSFCTVVYTALCTGRWTTNVHKQ